MTLTLNAAIINTFVTMDQMAVCVYERGLVKYRDCLQLEKLQNLKKKKHLTEHPMATLLGSQVTSGSSSAKNKTKHHSNTFLVP